MGGSLRIVAIRHADRARRRSRAASSGHDRTLPIVGILSAGTLALALAGLVSASAITIVSADLPDPDRLGDLAFAQPTIVYDREGKVELGRFELERRRVVAFEDIPRHVLDATTAAEDRTFWENPGVDPGAIVAAAAEAASGDGERGASTITQQLVRARLLPADVVAPGSDRYLRKVKEIVQSLRLTETFPGEAGKERIITAYLNEIFYGHGAYGVAAAASLYFGVSLDELTIAQAALLAGLPKAPSSLDPYRYAEEDDEGHLVVPKDAPPVVRRDWILEGLARSGRWTRLSPAELAAALAEPVVLVGDRPARVRGGHFTWQVRRQLEALFPDVDLRTAGYRVITTLDWRAQRLASRWIAAAAVAPNLSRKRSRALLRAAKIPRRDHGWINALRGKDLHNGALVALDYRSGDVLAYVGSAGYDRDSMASRKFDPKYDAAGDGARQPGSAFKPVLYAAAFDAKRLTPGSLLLDVTTEFDRRQDWAPTDADQRERGPVLVRRALQYSLNIPAIRALERVGSERVAETAAGLGIQFQGGTEAFLGAGLAGALGTVEVTPFDLTATYATIANGGVRVPPRMILEVREPDGRVIWRAPEPAGERVISAASAYLVTDILEGNTDPRENPIWAEVLELRNGPGGRRRPAAVKTGTTNDARDLGTYGFLPPRDDGSGLVVGVWMGNSDHSMPRARRPATSLTAPAPLWQAFVRQYTKGWEVTRFARPKGLVRKRIDAWSGGRPGPWTRDTVREWFIRGTEPGRRRAVDEDGLLYRRACGGWRVDPVAAELGPKSWRDDVADWLARARRGVGVRGEHGSRTAYFWGERSWGGALYGACARPKPAADDDRGRGKGHDKEDRDGDDKDKGNGNGNGGGPPPDPEPTPPPGDGD